MSELTVSIESLAPMRVATVAVTSASPEQEAVSALLAWAQPQGILAGTFRLFGYDNCQPHPHHTYTAWLTVGPETLASGDITIHDFPGGLYAVTELAGVDQISPRWQQLDTWLSSSTYRHGTQVCLEEMLDPLDALHPRFKLYLSITTE